jgi:DNA polymerase V
MLGDFFSKGVAQLNLFDEFTPRENSESLMNVLDTLNKKGNKLWFAGQGVAPGWKMKRSLLSPAWTTRLADVPLVG